MDKNIYLVGGAVRDRLIGDPIQDKDYVAVGYTIDDFSYLQLVGKDFPVYIREDGSELALARVERKISSGYNGFETNTKNITLEEDLKRRDLTINSIAYDEQKDIYIDPYGGEKDIKKKTLRHTSEAFCEDPLRVLRLCRFRAKFGYEWKIHPSTKVLVYTMRDELSALQPDRVYKEIKKVLELQNSHLFFETLFELGVLDIVFPSLYQLTTLKEGSVYHQEGSVFIHTMMVLEKLKDQSPLLKLTALYHDIAKPYCYKKYGNSSDHENKEKVEPLIDIQIPAKLKNKMLFLISHHLRISKLHEMKSSKIAKFLESFKKDSSLLEDLIIFVKADDKGRVTDLPKVKLDEKALFETFNVIASYSPKEWIDSLENIPSGEAIAQHIHKKNIEFVKSYF